jgi:hypothetical protein
MVGGGQVRRTWSNNSRRASERAARRRALRGAEEDSAPRRSALRGRLSCGLVGQPVGMLGSHAAWAPRAHTMQEEEEKKIAKDTAMPAHRTSRLSCPRRTTREVPQAHYRAASRSVIRERLPRALSSAALAPCSRSARLSYLRELTQALREPCQQSLDKCPRC